MASTPSFQFYPSDWLSSLSILLMTPAEEGAYIRLLAFEWGQDDCGLPSDDDSLACISRLGKEWLKSKERILKNFRLADGRLYNDRLLQEKAKQDHNRMVRSIAGGTKKPKRKLPPSKPRDFPKPPEQEEDPVKGSLLDTPEFRKAWQDWQQHRKEKKKELTPLAIQKQIDSLKDMGLTRAVAAINYSIRNGWEGIYEQKEDKNPVKTNDGDNDPDGTSKQNKHGIWLIKVNGQWYKDGIKNQI